ncbi:hypothetical protein BLNAU_13708 [Blattamonas nauphoetae]|uniref:Uncharacterized protein n=1 Tax=Blattamonas nauphoetae TaxID=2049346 RepID=A0ABQ9XIN6_9EUKA|nr:hypothetical protein BLNAU_13708 [Blattamonas nauphoetae]
MIELTSGEYFATNLRIINRSITFFGVEDHVDIDVSESTEIALDLVKSSVTLVSITLIPSQASIFACAIDRSTLNLTNCRYFQGELSQPILEGSDSQLVINGSKFIDLIFTLSVSNSYFERIDVQAQKAILAGPEVTCVSVTTTRFKDITCTEAGELPEAKIEGVPNREVSLDDSRFENVTAPLSGVVVFGVQASKLNLHSVIVHNVDNAVRFSDNVAFAHTIIVRLESCETQNTTATQFWPDGGFLYLPHNSSQLYIINSNARDSSAFNGSGGWIFANECWNLTMDQCNFEDTYARVRGGLLCVPGDMDHLKMMNVHVVHSKSELEGGAVFLANPVWIEVSDGAFTNCNSNSQGGAFFFDHCGGALFSFRGVRFTSNWAASQNGMDVLFSYNNSTTYSVSEENFERCTSTSWDNKVSIRPFNVHTNWTNTAGFDAYKIVIGAIIGCCVALGVIILVTCVCCCCCGCCMACGYQCRQSKQYNNIGVQPKDTSRSAPQCQGQYLPQTPYPQQWVQVPYVYLQPAAQPAQFQQYPLCPTNQVGIDQMISKE